MVEEKNMANAHFTIARTIFMFLLLIALYYKTQKRDWAHAPTCEARDATVSIMSKCVMNVAKKKSVQRTVVGGVHHCLTCIQINLHTAVLLTASSCRVVSNRV